MNAAAIKEMREEVKQYIDQADARLVKMIHAMLEVDADEGWWASVPDNIVEDIEASIAQADEGQTISHQDVKKKYGRWFTK